MGEVRRACCLGVLLCLTTATAGDIQSASSDSGVAFDLVIRGGKVFDGTGNPWFRADVGILDGKIVAVGALESRAAERIIDAEGKVVTPGFIDLHSHADGGLASNDARRRAAPNLVFQGITTVVVNSDGRSPWPLRDQRETLGRMGHGPNVILQVGHGTVRAKAILGDHYPEDATPGEVRQMMRRGELPEEQWRREATMAEVEEMRILVRQAMDEGAWGVSAGLAYVPARSSTTDEVVALVEEAVPFGGTYIVHLRSQSPEPRWFLPGIHEPGAPTLFDAVQETIEIGERTGAHVVNSHIKVRDLAIWGVSTAIIRQINRARARGVSVWADAYSYNTTGSDGRVVLIPGWVLGLDPYRLGNVQGSDGEADYASLLRERLTNDPEALERLRLDVEKEVSRRGGPESIIVMDHPDSELVGKTIRDLQEDWAASLLEVALELQYEGYTDRHTGARLRGHSMSEFDVENFIAQPWTATATDGGIGLEGEAPTVHPRSFGTFPRRIAHYVMKREVGTVEDAIRSGTSLPAQILGLNDRGMIREGLQADLVVMDLDRLDDKATIFEPDRYPEGVEYVLVNGELVVDQGELTWSLPGRVLVPEESNRRYNAGGPGGR